MDNKEIKNSSFSKSKLNTSLHKRPMLRTPSNKHRLKNSSLKSL